MSMERLTSKRDWIEAEKDLSHEYGYSHIWRRLKQIEDILGDTYDLDRMRELVGADKAGSCVVLPRDMKAYFIAEDIECNEKWIEYFPIKDVFLKCGFGIESLTYSLKDVGKKIWLSVEAAEAALTKEVDHDRT